MTFFKLMTTTTIVGLISTASFANEINFQQTGLGGITSMNFSQTGSATETGNKINGNIATYNDENDAPVVTTETDSATLEGSLAELNIIQGGSGNTSGLKIQTGDSVAGSVVMATVGSNNESSLRIDQGDGDTLDYLVAIKGTDNSVTSNITDVNSTVKLQSVGSKVDYTITQTGLSSDAATHSIIADVKATEAVTGKEVTFTQTGVTNTIKFGDVQNGYNTTLKAYEFDEDGVAGLTLGTNAEVTITQSATNASYITNNMTVPDGGSLTINQTN